MRSGRWPGQSLPPGPRAPAALQTVLFLQRPFWFVRSCRRRYGPIFTLRLLAVGAVVYLADPRTIRKLFARDGLDGHAGEANALLEPLTGSRSILRLDREEHLAERRILSPAFHGEAIRRLEAVARMAAEGEEAGWPGEGPIRARPAMQRITFEVIARAVLGVHDAGFRARLLELFEPVFNVSMLAAAPILGRDLGPLTPGGRLRRQVQQLDAALFELIAERRRTGAREDVLGTLLAARDQEGAPLSDRHVRDELVTLLLAGHETTATALAWALERLARHPDVRDDLALEVAQGRTDLLDAVIKETLRVRPVVMDVARRLSAPLDLCGHSLPSGTVVMPAIYLVHLADEHYQHPEAFRPSRFRDGVDPGQWLPFGGGRRRCLGAALAEMEMRVILSVILSRRRPTTVDPRDERPRLRGVTFVPDHDATLVMRPRARAPVAESAEPR